MRSDFVKPLLLWYNENARDLPWRHTKDPYFIWVSEIMLQQTRVEAVLGYYERFITELPTVEDLAVCPEDTLLKLWEGLGYYSRVRNMQKAAKIICETYGGKMPQSAAGLMTLPGIGDYTAGAISSIAYGLAEPAVDGNVLRVVARLEALPENILSTQFKKSVHEDLRTLHTADDGTFGLINQAFMDLGAGVCLAYTAPKCSECPISSCCMAHAEGLENELPHREKKQKRKVVDLTVLILVTEENFAIRKRSDTGLLSGLYEFPNVPGSLSESEALCAVSQWGFSPLRIMKLTDAKHVFSHVEWRMTGYKILIAPPGFDDVNTVGPEREREGCVPDFIFADAGLIEKEYPVPSAFEKYAKELNIRTGKQRRKR